MTENNQINLPEKTNFPLHIVLMEPEIPPNTGNVIRLCANSGAQLHLIEPLGFDLEDKKLRRAGLDYHEWARVQVHANWAAFRQKQAGRVFAFTTRGKQFFHEVAYEPDDILLFGAETRGLPLSLLQELGENAWVRVPMQPNSRSLNLSNTVALAAYEVWRQWGYAGSR